MASRKRTNEKKQASSARERPAARYDPAVRDVMTANPALCTLGTSCVDAAMLMRDNDCGALPVVESLDAPTPVGVVTDRDLVVRCLAEQLDPDETLIFDVMTVAPFTIRVDAPLSAAARVMADDKVRRMIVVDEDGFCVGMLAQADLMRAHPERGEEVVERISRPGEERRPML